jgi:trigger factor
MQVRIENTSKVQRKLTITVDPGTIEKEFERQLIQAQKTAKLKGFRPGQVPITMVKKFYGEECRHRTLHQVVDDSLRRRSLNTSFTLSGVRRLIFLKIIPAMGNWLRKARA